MTAGAPLAGDSGDERLHLRAVHWAQEAPPLWRWGLAVAVAVVVALVAAGLTRTSVFGIDRIDVSGTTRLSREEVLDAAKLRLGRPLVSIDEAAVDRRLEALPRVARADVSTDWPGAVRLEIVERNPLLLAQTADKRWAEIGEGGVVLAVNDQPVAGLPVPVGLEAPTTPGATLDAPELLHIAAIMPPSLRALVIQVQKQPDGQLRLGLSSQTIVELGDSRQLADKLMAAATVLSHSDPKTIAVLDARSPHLPLTTPKGAVAPARPAVTTTTAPPQ